MKYSIKLVALMVLVLALAACGGAGTKTVEFTIVSTEPANNAENVEINTSISITVSSSLALDTEIQSQKIILTDSNTGLTLSGAIAVDDTNTVITFVPDASLNSNTSYKLSISRDFSSNLNQSLPRDYSLSFKTRQVEDQIAPVINARVPEENATDVVVNTSISATFSEAVKAEDVDNVFALYIIDPGTNSAKPDSKVQSFLAPSGNIVTLTPTVNLSPNTEYIVVVTGIVDDAGNRVEETSWRFTTGEGIDEEPPIVKEMIPLSGAIGIPVTRIISATFSEPMDGGSFSSNTVKVTNLNTGEDIAGSLDYAANVLTFTVLSNNQVFEPDNTYQVRIFDVKDIAGNVLSEEFQWEFTTNTVEQAAPEVINVELEYLENGSGVKPDSTITITFSEALFAESVDSDSIKLNDGDSGSLSFKEGNRSIVIFTPTDRMTEQVEHTINVAGIADEDLKELAADYALKFSVGDATPPRIEKLANRDTAESPANGSQNQGRDDVISLTFSEKLDEQNVAQYLMVKVGEEIIPGQLSIVNGNEIKFELEPSDVYPENTEVSVFVSTSVRDLATNTLAAGFSWTFRTGDFFAPSIQFTSPDVDQRNVLVDAEILVVFGSDEIIKDSTVTPDTFLLTNTVTGEVVDASITVLNNTITLKPSEILAEKTVYRVTVNKTITDLADRPLDEFTEWTFITADNTSPEVAVTSPVADAVGVAVKPEIMIEFTEEIDAASLTAESVFVLDENQETVALDIEIVDAKNIKLTPVNSFIEQAIYTVYLTEDIFDLSGNLLFPSNWSITIGDFTAPTAIIDSLILDEFDRVSTLPEFTVNFSEIVNIDSANTSFQLISVNDGTAVELFVDLYVEEEKSIATISVPNELLNEKLEYQLSFIDSLILDQSENPLIAVEPLNFVVGDFTAPTGIINRPIVDGLGKIGRRPIWTVTFDEPIVPSLTAFSFVPDSSELDGREFIVLNVAWNENNTIAELSLMEEEADLIDGESYKSLVDDPQLLDLTGNELALVSSLSFEVGDFASPSVIGRAPYDLSNSNLQRFPRSSSISVTFDEDIDVSSVNSNTFSVVGVDEEIVPGKITQSSGILFTFTPNTDLGNFSEYVVTISSDIVDIAGNNLIAPVSWNFKTNDEAGPRVVQGSQFPAPGFNNAALKGIVEVIFDEAMNTTNTSLAFKLSLVSTDNPNDSTKVPGTVSFESRNGIPDNTLIFTPDDSLLEERQYVVTISVDTATDVNSQNLTPFPIWSFITGDEIAPSVVTINIPSKNTFGQLDRLPVITVTFSEAMLFADLTDIDFEFTNSLGAANPSLQVIDRRNDEKGRTLVTVKPRTSLASEIDYRFNVKTTVTDDSVNKNSLSNTATKSLNIGDYTPPIANIVPPSFENGDPLRGVGLNPSWEIEFDSSMRRSTVTNATFTLAGLASPPLKVRWSNSDRRATISLPSGITLLSQTSYSIRVSSDITDLSNNNLAAIGSVTFKTGDFVRPTATIVPPTASDKNRIILTPTWRVVFAKKMDTGISNTAFTLSGEGSPSVLNVIWNEPLRTTATISVPGTTPLLSSTTYTMKVSTGIRDYIGNKLLSVSGVSFITGEFVPPSIKTSSRNPKPDASNVPKENEIRIQFNEVMDELSTKNAFSISPNTFGGIQPVVTGNTLTFKPFELGSGVTYTVTIATSAQDLSGNALTSSLDNSWRFTVEDYIPPTVQSTVPTGVTATAIAIPPRIQVVFSELMDASSTIAAFSIDPAVAGKTIIVGNILTFTPTATIPDDTSFKVSIGTRAKDASGVPLALPYEWFFKTVDATAPTALINQPEQDSLGRVSRTPSWGVVFDEPVARVDGAFILAPLNGGANIPLDVVWLASNTQATLSVSGPLNEQEQYISRVDNGLIQDVAGNSLTAVEAITFTVGDFLAPTINAASRTPTPGSTTVGKRDVISVTFSEVMDKTTTEAAFSISPSVNGGAVLVGDTLTFTATADMNSETSYTVSIANTALDESRNPLDNTNGSWSFTIVDYTSPTVNAASRTPTPASINVAVRALISLKFSEPMDKTTTEAAFKIIPNVAGGAVLNGDTLTFTPTADMSSETKYTVSITNTALDSNNNSLDISNASWSFTTLDYTAPTINVTSRMPVPSSENAEKRALIRLKFSEPMDKTSTEAAFKIDPSVAGGAVLLGDTLTFTPTADMNSEAKYTVSIANTAKDKNGNQLDNTNGSWDFTVKDYVAPTINTTSRTPAPASTEIAERAPISLKFSEIMNKATTEAAFSISPSVSGNAVLVDDTLTFTPTDDMSSETEYTVSIANTALDSNNNPLDVSNASWSFTTLDYKAPTINTSSRAPAPNSTSVAKRAPIILKFSEPMDRTTTEAAFGLLPDVAGGAVLQGDTLTFTPTADMDSETQYAVSIANTAKDKNGNLLDNANGNWSFTIKDYIVPTVNAGSRTPTPASIDVAKRALISLTFSEPMDKTTTEAAFQIDPSVAGGAVLAGDTLTFTPTADMNSGASYTVSIANTALDKNNNPLNNANGSWSFSIVDFAAPTVIAASRTPAPSSNDVAKRASVSVKFSENMDKATTEAAFSILPFIAGGAVLVGDTLTFTPTPSADMESETLYEVSIATTALDKNGNSLGNANRSWSFTVEDYTAPTIKASSRSPGLGATGVLKRQAISVTFSEAMDKSTTEAAFSLLPVVSGGAVLVGDTLTFTPSADMSSETTYSVTIATTATDKNNNPLTNANRSWDFTTADFIKPNIQTLSPADSTGVIGSNGKITINFSEPVNTQDFGSSTLTLTLDGQLISTSVVGAPIDADSISYTIGSPDLVANGLYHAVFNESIVDIAGNSDLINIEWSFTSGSLIEKDGSAAAIPGGQVLNNEKFSGAGSLNYVITGLTASTRYGFKLSTSSNNLGLFFYSDANATLACESNDSSSKDEICSATTNSDGEIYLKVVNSGSGPSFDLDVLVSSDAFGASGSVSQSKVNYVAVSTGGSGDYIVGLTALTGNADLYVFNDDAGLKLTNTEGCRSNYLSNSVEYCTVTVPSGSTDVKLLIEGVSSSSVSYQIVTKPELFITLIPAPEVSRLLSRPTEYFVLNGLTASASYDITVVSPLNTTVDLTVFDNRFLRSSCSDIGFSKTTVTCSSFPHESGELYLQIDGFNGNPIDITVSPTPPTP